ncbi:hypothetical protein HU200_016088 [Digitaria exilis]|uniref:Uncharacterized protein n=1 Tax=Digitaria exilis TaxID=1010633 RepID=A0A835FA55_9POAL|nr:hypothetical protein HU200_016088 [Digitaria exilis]
MGITRHLGMFKQPRLLGTEIGLPTQVHLDVIMIVLWQRWKARNAMIFDQKALTANGILRRVIDVLDALQIQETPTLNPVLGVTIYMLACNFLFFALTLVAPQGCHAYMY